MVKWAIGTYARLRPPRRGHDCAKFLLEKLGDDKDPTAAIVFPPPDEDDERLQMKQREELEFHFKDIFDPGVSQEQVFNDVCRDIVYSALDGYNGTILAYGQTGSGKTYTITGGEHYADRGIIPRVLSTIFEEFEQRVHMRYSCYISFLEIYNESVYDLLDRSHTDRPIEEWPKVQLMDDEDGDMHFRNLGVYEAISEEEALNLLFLGNMNRVTSDTPMNQASSRSHSIFSVMIEARQPDSDMIVTSKLHLVDLAGSERVYKREGTQRMRSEGKHINLSLHHLEQVILSLRTRRNSVAKGYHVPYRNSMLTSVLRGSLGGNCKSVFIATLNPEADFVDESISTCRFMQRCSEVTVDVAVNAEVDTEKRLEALEKTNAKLETTNSDLQARVVQLEKDLQTQEAAMVRQGQQWEAHVQQVQREADDAVEAVKREAVKAVVPVDWIQCELLVERLVRIGKLPRHRLSICSRDAVSPTTGSGESDEELARGLRLMEKVTSEIRELGLEVALGCLAVMRESAISASGSLAELQEVSRKQQAVLDHLEKRLQDQRVENDQLRAQAQRTAWIRGSSAARTESSSSSVRHWEDADGITIIPRSKSHSGAGGASSTPPSDTGDHRRRLSQASSGSRARSVADDGSRQSRAMGTESDSEIDNESEANSESHGLRAHSSSSSIHRHKSLPQGIAFESDHDTTSLSRRSARKQDGVRRSVPVSSPGAVATVPPSALTKLLQHQGSGSSTLGSAGRLSNDLIRRRLGLLQSGSLFVKYGRLGKPHVRFVWCSADLEHLHYRAVRSSVPKASIATRTISRVFVGQATRVFERAKQDARAPFCFSIEYEDARTLDLEVADSGEPVELKMVKRGEWVEALQLLAQLQHEATISALAASAIQPLHPLGILMTPASGAGVATPSALSAELGG